MKHSIIVFTVLCTFLVTSCEDFLDYAPKGTVSGEQLTTAETVNGLVTAAYAMMGNDFWTRSHSHMWFWGSVRAEDSFKGGGSVGDQYPYHRLETHSLITTDESRWDWNWQEIFDGIHRANEALRKLNALEESWDLLEVRKAEARFVRAHFYFVAKRIWKRLPWVDETIEFAEIKNIGNQDLSDQELWDKIAADFQFGVDNLPEVQSQVGRVNKFAATAYLAKTKLYQAYEQDANHSVVSINSGKLAETLSLLDNVINSGAYSLSADFGMNFLPEYESGVESVFSIRYSIEDGTTNGRIQMATSLNYNMLGPYGCCDFHNPSYSMLSAFETTDDGLPLFEGYNDEVLFDAPTWAGLDNLDGIDWMGPTVDPRMDHSIAIPTHPFKYDPDFLMTRGGRRVPEIYGYLSSLKEAEHHENPAFKKIGPFFGTSRDLDIIRYDDILLMKAEVLIQMGNHNEALPLINMIRKRASESTDWLVQADGSPTANYFISEYEDGVNCTWTADFAWKALKWERFLEFAFEGHRFFDLVRWGEAAETINAYLPVENQWFAHLNEAFMTAGQHEYVPIPQNQINLTEGRYIQNTGY